MRKKLRLKIYDKFLGHCAYCGCEIEYKDMQVDHIVSKRSGGLNEYTNYFPSCRICNHYKRSSTIEGFRKMIEEIPRKLKLDYTYKIGLKYGNIKELPNKILFYFETYQ